MLRTTVTTLAALVLLSAAVHGQQSPAAAGATPAAAPAGDAKATQQAVRQVTDDFVKAFNTAKADDLAALFLDDGQLTDDAGTVHQGRAAIKEAFARFFEKFPGASSKMTSQSIWMVRPTLAIDEGQRLVLTRDGRSSAASRYTLVMLKQAEGWKIAAGREVEDDASLAPHDHLQALAWLVGDWVNEGPDALVQMSCRWSDDKNFLLTDFVSHMGGRAGLKSSQRIGWDPLSEKIKSWVFDSDGGHGEAQWTQIENQWVIKSSAVLPDGSTGSATIIIEPRDKNSYTMKGFDRIRGNVASPDFDITVVRKSPEPAK